MSNAVFSGMVIYVCAANRSWLLGEALSIFGQDISSSAPIKCLLLFFLHGRKNRPKNGKTTASVYLYKSSQKIIAEMPKRYTIPSFRSLYLGD